ncbi:MAG: TIGR03618 family F420-dependent PPOX class oxidoreductase [Chloroflexi bacterium]|nr:TIGR03618 family F420-dependent PPOX class oxidoreductase [Chloroflexota bacterium]
MTPEERKAFLQEHRLAIVGAERVDAPPQLSPVYYVMDGDDLLISTTATRAKSKVIRRNARVSVCVLGEQPPFPYLTVYGRGRIEAEGAADLMMTIGGVMAGSPLPESMRPAIEERAKTEQRVVLRVTPQSYFP